VTLWQILFLSLTQRPQQIFHRRIIPKRPTEMPESIHITRPKHKAPAQLKRILPQLMLLVSRGLCPVSRHKIVFLQYVKNIRRLQFQRVIRFLLLINQKRKRNPRLLPEYFCVLRISQTYCRQRRSFRSKLLFVRAQLRDVLPAENSTVMPQKHHHRRLRRPQRPQPHLSPIRIRQHNHRQSAAQRSVHTSSRPCRPQSIPQSCSVHFRVSSRGPHS